MHKATLYVYICVILCLCVFCVCVCARAYCTPVRQNALLVDRSGGGHMYVTVSLMYKKKYLVKKEFRLRSVLVTATTKAIFRKKKIEIIKYKRESFWQESTVSVRSTYRVPKVPYGLYRKYGTERVLESNHEITELFIFILPDCIVLQHAI